MLADCRLLAELTYSWQQRPESKTHWGPSAEYELTIDHKVEESQTNCQPMQEYSVHSIYGNTIFHTGFCRRKRVRNRILLIAGNLDFRRSQETSVHFMTKSDGELISCF